MPPEDIPVEVWQTAWADLEEVVIGGGSSRELVRNARPDSGNASHWLVSARSIVFMKAVARLAYIRRGMVWDRPQTAAVARFLTDHNFPVEKNRQLREGIRAPQPADDLGKNDPQRTPDYETHRRLARPEQAQFREELKQVYGLRCAISGCEVEAALEACHIVSHEAGGPADQTNGLFLRRDLHRLFDLGLIAVEPETRLWRCHDDLADHYGSLFKDRHGPDFEADDVRLDRLKGHWKASQLTDRERL